MGKIGRNDPCPCGSGKKYKNCCLQKDVASEGRKEIDFTYASHLAMRRKATEKMARIMLKDVTPGELQHFEEDYWASPFLDDDQAEALNAHPRASELLEERNYFATLNCLKIKGKTPAQHALAHHSSQFTADEAHYLREFDRSRVTYIQVAESFPETGSLRVLDLFSGEVSTVYDNGMSVHAKPHDIFSGRMLPLPEKSGFAIESLTLTLHTPADRETIIRNLENLAQDKHLNTRGLGLSELLQAEPVVVFWLDLWFLHRQLFPKTPTLVNHDGHAVVNIIARFKAEQPEKLIAALNQARNFENESSDSGLVFTWLNRKDTVLGFLRVKPDQDIFTLECNSRQRFKKWEKKLQTLGDVRLLDMRETPMEFHPGAPVSRDLAGFPTEKFSPAEMDELLPVLEEKIFSSWVKEKIPALGGQTPVQAAKSETGREKLKQLLDEMENLYARSPSPMNRFDVDKLRKRLGM